MIAISITTDIEKTPWSDQETTLKANGLGVVTKIGRLPRGIASGMSSVSIVIQMPNGKEYVGQTSLVVLEKALFVLTEVDKIK